MAIACMLPKPTDQAGLQALIGCDSVELTVATVLVSPGFEELVIVDLAQFFAGLFRRKSHWTQWALLPSNYV